jgi:hypothetical protein
MVHVPTIPTKKHTRARWAACRIELNSNEGISATRTTMPPMPPGPQPRAPSSADEELRGCALLRLHRIALLASHRAAPRPHISRRIARPIELERKCARLCTCFADYAQCFAALGGAQAEFTVGFIPARDTHPATWRAPHNHRWCAHTHALRQRCIEACADRGPIGGRAQPCTTRPRLCHLMRRPAARGPFLPIAFSAAPCLEPKHQPSFAWRATRATHPNLYGCKGKAAWWVVPAAAALSRARAWIRATCAASTTLSKNRKALGAGRARLRQGVHRAGRL